ncbi:DUF2076 domain-containing protein [Musicola paradisiaca]|uniref:Periplasmic ligand-binding sensor protein n=1 Tax=Musicola paradisiaca (strain Ech703) TaxID=579405 RepID=C6CDM4_MUSP7|nr:DUF2076 domain-containing protein [Musicola paradisiaca]ACS85141.1 putative periplasmic ligand-binding sensor protein [Musicola paradisiaca Ech703]
MQSEEQRLIDGLFSRLKDAETKTGPRDLKAEQQISDHIRQQPAAPYYMAQAMIIQEAALKQLDQRVRELENEVNRLRQEAARPQQSSGGFLAGLFGGGRTAAPAPQQYQQPVNNGWGNQPAPGYGAQPGYSAQPGYAQPAPSRAGGFLGGALQTAAGVAGGVVLADMLTSMFHSSKPQEIVNIIEETPQNLSDGLQNTGMERLDAFGSDNGSDFLNAGYDSQDSGFDAFGSDSYDDDDSYL